MKTADPMIHVAITKRKDAPMWKTAHQCPSGSSVELKIQRHRTAPWTQLYLEESYMTETNKLVSRQTGINLSNTETRRLINTIAPGLIKHAMVAAEVLRGLQKDSADREVLTNLDAALAELYLADRKEDAGPQAGSGDIL